MTATGSLSYFSQHRGSKSCKKKEQVQQAATVTREAQTVLQTMVCLCIHPFCTLVNFFLHKVPSHNTSSSVPSASHQSESLNKHLHDVPSPPTLPPGPLYQPFTVLTSPHLPSIDDDELSDLAMADLQSSSLIPDIDSSQECTGVLVKWTAGSVWDTYPYHQHGIRNHPWEPIGFEGNNTLVVKRLLYCTSTFFPHLVTW